MHSKHWTAVRGLLPPPFSVWESILEGDAFTGVQAGFDGFEHAHRLK